MDAARSLEAVIAADRQRSEADRRLTPEVVAGIRSAGLQRLMLNEADGGLALPLPAALQVYESLAGFDASVGWIVWNNALPCLFSRFLPAVTRADVFADADWLHASSTRPSGKAVPEAGGYRLDGRWSLVSGCELAEWMPLTAMVTPADGGEPEMRYFFLRQSELTILDTWHVGGLRSTGSHDVVVEDFLVPTERSISPSDPSTASGPYGVIPIIATLALGMAAQFLGIAASALAATTTLAVNKVSPGPTPDMRDRPDMQAGIASSNAAVAAARSHLHQNATELWDLALTSASFSATDIAAVFAASSHAIRTGTEVVDTMYSLAGTSAIYEKSPLERISRDMRVMRQHVLTQSLWPEQAGRIQLGLAADNPLFAV